MDAGGRPTPEAWGRPGDRAVALLLGALGCAAFFGLDQTATTLQVVLRPPWERSEAGEVYLWLAYALLLTPAAALVGLGLSGRVGPALAALWRRAGRMDRRERLAALLALGAVALLLARLGRALFLLDLPITDDEYACRFGGQALALGHVTVPAPAPLAAFPRLFMYLAPDGRYGSFDFPGCQVAWALGELLGAPDLPFAAAAALAPVAVGALVARRLGGALGLAAAALLLCSPMAATLALTTHAHLLSRGLLAVTLALYARAEARGGSAAWGAVGLAWGAAVACRPAEVAAITAPLALDLALGALRGRPQAARAVAALLVGAAPPLLLFALHNLQLTGHPLHLPRLTPNELAVSWSHSPDRDSPDVAHRLWYRFGANTSYNLITLVVWFLGPIGVLLVALGVGADRLTRLLGLGVLTALGVSMLQDDNGVHVVGPIHYSECAVALAVIAASGLARALAGARALRLPRGALASALAAALVLGGGTFACWHLLALRRSQVVQRLVYDTLEASPVHHAIVLAPRYVRLLQRLPPLGAPGSWVFEWRRARPDLSDDLLILHDVPGIVPELRRRYPDRPLYRLRALDRPPLLELEPLGAREGP